MYYHMNESDITIYNSIIKKIVDQIYPLVNKDQYLDLIKYPVNLIKGSN